MPPPRYKHFTITLPVDEGIPDVRATYRGGTLHITVPACPSLKATRLAEALLAEARYILRDPLVAPDCTREAIPPEPPREPGERDSWLDAIPPEGGGRS